MLLDPASGSREVRTRPDPSRWLWIATVALACALPVGADDTQVNTTTSGDQTTPAVAVDSDGDFVVVWTSAYSSEDDDSGTSIQVQRFQADGSLAGGEIQVNTYTTNDQGAADVAMDDDGNFVVVWESHAFASAGPDDSGTSIQGRIFSSDGMPQTSQFQVNSYSSGDQNEPAVAMDADGDFVVVWESLDVTGPGNDSDRAVKGQRFNSAGVPQATEIQINVSTSSNQHQADVAMSSLGEWVVVWRSLESAGDDTTGYSVQMRRFLQNGSAIGGEMQVNTYTTNTQGYPAVASDATGDFVVAWQDLISNGPGDDTDPSSIQAQLFAGTTSSTMPVGIQFQVNTYTTGPQIRPSVAMDADGDFVVVWASLGGSETDTSASSIQAQRYSSPFALTDGAPSQVLGGSMPVGSQFQVNTTTLDYQDVPNVAIDDSGEFVVVWESETSYDGDSSRSIQKSDGAQVPVDLIQLSVD